jgi:hypothetical protein
VTRRIPAALGLVIVIVAVHELSSLAPMFAMMLRDGMDLPWVIWLLLGGAVAQLVAGIAIATEWTHARVALLAWTLLAVATFIFARDELFAGSASASIVVFAELLVGPALAWFVPLWLGDAPRQPRIPRAHVVSPTAHPGDGVADPDKTSRRFDLGVVLFGLGIIWILNTLVSRVLVFVLVMTSGGNPSSLLGELVFFAHAIGTGIFAIIAAKRLVDPTAEPHHARSAVTWFVVVDIVGTVIRTLVQVGFLVLAGDLDSEMVRTLAVQWCLIGALQLVIPLVIWWYARSALSYRSEGPLAQPPPSRLAAAPAWAMLWLAPFLLTRLFTVGILDTSELSPMVLTMVGIACAIQGVVYLVAAIATFVARKQEATNLEAAYRAYRIARIASVIGFATAVLLLLGWIFLLRGLDAVDSFRQQGPIGPLVKLIA